MELRAGYASGILDTRPMPINENSEYTSRFSMVFKPETRAQLQRLAEDAGLKESELLRKWVAESYAARFGKRKAGEVVAKPNSAEAREGRAKRSKK